jgi:hypothetical protein
MPRRRVRWKASRADRDGWLSGGEFAGKVAAVAAGRSPLLRFLFLGHETADFAAIEAVVTAVLAQPDIVIGFAERTEARALAISFR